MMKFQSNKSASRVKNCLKKKDDSDNEDISLLDDDSDDSDYESDDEEEEEDEDEESDDEDEEEKEEEDEISLKNKITLQKELAKLFPSNYMNEKLKNSKKVFSSFKKDSSKKEDSETKKKPTKKESDKKSSKKEDSDSEEEEETAVKKHKKSKKEESDKKTKKEEPAKKTKKEDSESESEDEKPSKKDKISIILNVTGDEDEYEDEEEYEEECMLYENEDENEECDTDDEKTFMKENYQETALKPAAVAPSLDKKSAKKNMRNKSLQEKEELEEMPKDRDSDYKELFVLKKFLSENLIKNPQNTIMKKAFEDCQKEINKLVKTARFENTKKYHKLIYSNRNKTDEFEYFKKNLSNKEQLTIMKDLKEINKHIGVETPYRLQLLRSNMPHKFKAVAMQKLNMLKNMDPVDTEYFKIKNWVDTFMKIPFGIYKSLSISMKDGLEVSNDFLMNAKRTLDDCVYGLDDAKIQVMQMMGQWIANPAALGTAIAIKGPMGTGKTTIVKEGISKILGREFTFIALGGAGDSSFLEGHSYTYEGSTWGKIVQILIDSKCMNPVIYFDELDKISDTPRGQEIIGILTHLTDTTQNSQFHDKYFSEIDFDLSKCLFIFSYNDETRINPILKDRMYSIQTKGYDSKEKIIIARNYLLPKIREQVNFSESEIVIPDEVIQYIVNHEGMTKKEDGVRNLKRCLEIIYTKLNLFRLVKPENNLFGKQLKLEVSFPFTVTKDVVDLLIKNDENQRQSILAMYV